MCRIDFCDTFAFPFSFFRDSGSLHRNRLAWELALKKHIIICHLATAGRAHDIWLTIFYTWMTSREILVYL